MKTKLLTGAVAAASFLVLGARAETTEPAVSMPTPATPAPVVAAPAAVVPNQVIYSPRLPSAGELANAAAAQGINIERIEQTSSQVMVIYKYASGQTMTVAYQLLPAAGTPAAPVGATSPSAPPPTVVYYDAGPRVAYYDPGYYYPGYWYPPVSLSLGWGFGYYGRGYYRGGGYSHGGFHHRGR